MKVLYKKFEESFASVAIEMNLMIEKQQENKMDVVSTEAMLQEANLTTKSARILSCHLRQHFGRSKKKDLQKIQGEKTKINTPVSAEIENILLQHNISAAAYHGGKLNGVDCHEFIFLAKQISPIFKLIFSPWSTQIDAVMT
jgi:hypothetical protein